MSVIILVGNFWIQDQIYLLILFAISEIAAMLNVMSKSLLLLRVALAKDPNSTGFRTMTIICWTAAITISLLVIGFLFAAANVSDPVIKDGLTVGWIALGGIECAIFMGTFLKYGNSVIRLLREGLDQSETIQDAILRLKHIRNQAFLSTLITSVLLIVFAAIPYLRSIVSQVLAGIALYFSVSNFIFIRSIRKSEEKNPYNFNNANTSETSLRSSSFYKNNSGGETTIEVQGGEVQEVEVQAVELQEKSQS